MDWQTLAKTKRDSVNALIPPSWRLPSPVPPAAEQRNVTGKYIQQFLSPREIEITETDAVGIVKQTTVGSWTALEVTEAFCHRAALAHQMVCFEGSCFIFCLFRLCNGKVDVNRLNRLIVCTRYSLRLPFLMRGKWMSIILRTGSRLDYCMACLLV